MDENLSMMRDSSSVKSPTVAFWVGQDDDDECDFVDTNEGMDLGDSERISLLPKGSGSGSLREQANHSPNVPLHKHVPSVLDLIASPTSHNNSTAASHLVATADSTLLEAPVSPLGRILAFLAHSFFTILFFFFPRFYKLWTE